MQAAKPALQAGLQQLTDMNDPNDPNMIGDMLGLEQVNSNSDLTSGPLEGNEVITGTLDQVIGGLVGWLLLILLTLFSLILF